MGPEQATVTIMANEQSAENQQRATQHTGKVEERKSPNIDSLVPCDNITSSNTNRLGSKSDLEASAGHAKLTQPNSQFQHLIAEGRTGQVGRGPSGRGSSFHVE